MKVWIARLTHPGRFRPSLLLTAAVGVTALFFAVIAVNVQLAHQLAVFRSGLADRFTRHLLIITLVTGVFVLMLTAAWIVIVRMMRRFYRAQARVESALRESENRYRVLVENLPQKIFLKDRTSVYVSCNENYAQDLKIKPWEIVGKTDCDFYPGELAEKYRADDQRIMESGNGEEIEEEYLQHGKEVFVHTAKTPIRDDQGHVSGILGIFWDITERKRTQEALRESETKYRALIDVLPHGVVIMQDGIFRFSNPAADAMFGCSSPDGLAGLPWESIVAERDRERVRGIMEARARGEAGVPTQYPVDMRRGDQEEFPAEVYVRPFQYGGRFAVQEVILDVTERRQAEEALRESEERFRNLADLAPVLIWMAGVKRHTFYFNSTWQTFTGRSVAQEYGQGWQQGVHPEDLPRLLAAYDSAFASHSPLIIEYRLRHADGTYHWVLDTGIPRFASEQRFAGYIGSCVDISIRLETEHALRDSEERFRTLYHKTPAMLHSLDAKGRLIGVSDFWLEAMGYEHNEVIGRPVSDFLFPQSPPGGGASSPSLLLNNGDIKNVSQQFVTKSGRVMDTIVSAVSERDADGTVQGSLAVIMDVSDLQRAERARIESEQRYRLLAENVNDVIWTMDPELRFTLVSPAMAQWTGYTPEEMLGLCVLEIVAPSSAPRVEQARVALMQSSPGRKAPTHQLFELELRHRNGSAVWVEVNASALLDAERNFLGFTGVAREINERKRTEQVQSVLVRLSEAAAMAESLEAFLSVLRKQLSALLDTTNFYVALYNEETGSYMASVFADESNGFNLARQPDVRSMTDYVRRTGTPILADQTVLDELRRAGQIELEGTPGRQWMGVPLRTSRGVIGVMVAQSHDDHAGYTPRDLEILTLISGNLAGVIERKRAVDALITGEEQLRQSQKMEAIGRMAGGIAHDFNNLLTSILGHSEITLRGLRADHPLRDGVEEVAKAAERAAGLTRQLLAFSRKQVLQPRVLDLNAIVADVEKMLRRLIGEDIELLTRLQPDLGMTKADPSQIEQVLMNLVMNARDAMPAGGRLIIETANVAPDEIQDWRRKKAVPAPYVLLAVSDNGTGMDAETRSHIYEPFFTTKECGKGTGLGLSTVYGIVKQSGGHIWVYSELGRGTVFRIYLPRVAGAAEELKPPEPNAPQNGRETILLVEDEDCVRNLMRQVLEGKGYRVRAARLPSEALQLAEIHHGAIDLLIADVIVPEINGGELAEKVIALHPETKVLFISGYPHHSLGRFGVIEPGKTFLEKPFNAEALASHVRQLLDTRVTAS